MKLVFRKNDEEEISVFQSVDGEESRFSYSEMINTLIKSHQLENPETLGDFTGEERKSIVSMVENINKVLRDSEEADENSESGEIHGEL
jgi:hypothetical protein